MEIRKRILPEPGFSGVAERALWRECFGGIPSDAEVDIFISGRERVHNVDVLFSAEEPGELLATCHLTIDRRTGLGGLGEVAVAAAHRGRGLGRAVCEAALEEFDSGGGRAIFLATGNPAAAALYSSLGFSFLPGSRVMLRCTGSQVEFFRRYFCGGAIRVEAGTPSFRVPVIPLALYGHGLTVLDANAGIFGTEFITQGACMGLYPRYAHFVPGRLFVARGDAGEISGAATLKQGENCWYGDLFAHRDYPEAWPRLLEILRSTAGADLRIPVFDEVKRQALAEAGARPDGTTLPVALRFGFTAAAELYRF